MRATEIEDMIKTGEGGTVQEVEAEATLARDMTRGYEPNNPQLGFFPNQYIDCTISALPRMPSDSLLPGQPVPLPRGPALQLGSGIYTRNGETRASLFGTPVHQGSVGFPSFCTSLGLNNYLARLGF